ncbi:MULTISPECIES: NADH:flavin oxidoreductase/NADH oxidase family protein [Thalassospira]|uniref:Oxidoreductase n=2 Tax=Thalassospira tepidiphila TaxID=393657 RepID=A0A853KUT8_9PROT|nr:MULTISPECIES: NADH:flavin oxidoreductase/NADH oxidase family protein [Thalassospira]MBO6581263.1 NADH:flavin oxidoreductase/NADH oxidase family protein [Thalassospira sp.]MBO6819269.1 NADH:flavin oxidoreductase/NADH oxidase family protein [Thalassospira sp.]MBO6889699.1 NADH:flavin oxidoreductase/NADH oxidase family protein [Thalassospira sp.]NJB76725.1 2,4-dienoyl-CoA reductase-like NADH-dependent reductase (Old Yellow Enzyme family) [Thalassospira tepidiphila]OAZ07860.1 oxidoreductase [Th
MENPLFRPLELPSGVILKNRIAKSAMSDSLGDGTGHPTKAQNRLYRRWAEGGVGVSIIGEVQAQPGYAEKPGNLVLDDNADLNRFRALARQGAAKGSNLWLQLGHAGALAFAPTSTPKGPSALDLPGLKCAALTDDEIRKIPARFARTAKLAEQAGFGGVQIHAAHGFLLNQFLSPLFNRRRDDYGGSIANRMRLLLETIGAVRAAVGHGFVVAVKLNATDQLEGGLSEDDALAVVTALDQTKIDLIDISGVTYFPGAKAASDGAGGGPYFMNFAKRARKVTTKPLMLTGGFKTRAQAEQALNSGVIDIVGLARALVIEPALPHIWQRDDYHDPVFPRFDHAPAGGITAWYTMRLTALAGRMKMPEFDDLDQVLAAYEARDADRARIWLRHFDI